MATLVDYYYLLHDHIDFMNEICIFVKTFERIILCGKISYVSFDDVLGYYDKEFQFVILLNMTHLDNTTIFSFPKSVILKM